MVTISLKQYTELVEKALRYDLLRRREEDNKFLSNDERILYGFAKKPETVFVAKPEEASKAEDDDF